MNTGETPVASPSGLLTTVAWRLGKDTHYALEGSAFIAGAAGALGGHHRDEQPVPTARTTL